MVSHKDGSLLMEAILDYAGWLKETQESSTAHLRHIRILRDFSVYVIHKGLCWDEMFTFKTIDAFQAERGYKGVCGALTALSDYLLSRGKIAQPFPLSRPKPPLPGVYEEYRLYHAQSLGSSPALIKQIRTVLRPFMRIWRKMALPFQRSRSNTAMPSCLRLTSRTKAASATDIASEGF